MATLPNYPAPGCIVEFLEGNAVNIAYVLEEAGGKLRLLLPGRREMKLPANRILPWPGPQAGAALGREEAVKILEEHRKIRESRAPAIPVVELWELAQGEVAQASAKWLAELMESDPDVDTIAAYGRALLNCKSHFRFQPPEFQVFTSDIVEKRLREQEAKAVQEKLVAGGSAFLHMLWDAVCKKRPLDANADNLPDENVAAKLEKILFARVANPDSQEGEALWQHLRKGLPEVPHLPQQLLTAWGKLPKHYNFWLDRADFAPGDDWWRSAAREVETLAAQSGGANDDDFCDLPFISIDSPKTRDVDDAFYIEPREGGGWNVTVALACPAARWPFESAFDKMILHRGTSIYLPEGDMHMMPEALGTNYYSLLAGQNKIAFLLRLEVDGNGNVANCAPRMASVSLAANLNYHDVQAVLDGSDATNIPHNPAVKYAAQLRLAHAFAQVRQKSRIEAGAVVMERPEPEIVLEEEDGDYRVDLRLAEPAPAAQLLIAELMIAASSATADWSAAKNIPMLHRVQPLALPREYAGIWSRPEDLSRIMRALTPSSLEVEPKPHAALALASYAPITSPLRRYTDLVNEAQILHYLENGAPRWNEKQLADLLYTLSPVLEAVGHIQRYRPRYWKLLYFRQQGDKVWWNGVITEENENFVNVSLPHQGLFARGRRELFDERACPGQHVKLRLGKVNPLYNEIHILEVLAEE